MISRKEKKRFRDSTIKRLYKEYSDTFVSDSALAIWIKQELRGLPEKYRGRGITDICERHIIRKFPG